MTTHRQSFDCLVVGAGPAGMSAARIAATAGATVGLVDAYAAPGGQYAMATHPRFPRLGATSAAALGRDGEKRLEAAGVTLFRQAEVFAAEPGFRLGARQGDRTLILKAGIVIAATGAHEVVHPFPGWTLPGVMTAGAAQRLIKGSGVSPGQHVMLAGNGPFLYAVAQSFALAGLKLDAFVDAGGSLNRALPTIARFAERWGESISLLRDTQSAVRKRHERKVVIEALGERRLEAVRIAPLDRRGMADRTAATTVTPLDALCISHGFAPVIDLTAMLGAAHDHDPAKGGWHCRVEPTTGETTVAGLFAAGETIGLGGVRPAALSGELAGAAAARLLGHKGPDVAGYRIVENLARARSFASALMALWPEPPALAQMAQANTTICRCEDVSRSAIEAALADGAADLGQTKLWSRAGMGLCQGRFCGPSLTAITGAALGKSAAELGFNPPRFPLRPVSASIAAEWARD